MPHETTLGEAVFGDQNCIKGFAKVVDAIYDCAIFPSRWQGVIHMLSELCASPFSFLATHDYASQRSKLMFTLGYSLTFVNSYESEYARLDPLFEPIRAAPLGVVETRSMLIDDEDYYSSRFYREWAQPQGLGDCILVNVLQSQECFAWLGAHRYEVASRYQCRDIGLVASLAPDVCRTASIGAAFKKQRLLVDALETSLDALASGVFLVDRRGRKVYTNPAAERQVKANRGLRLERERLIFTDTTSQASFECALSETLGSIGREVVRPIVFGIPDGSRLGLVGTVLPLRQGQQQDLCGSVGAIAAVFVQDPVVGITLPGEAFAKLYRLTDCERRVLLSLASGQCIKEIAVALGVSEPTVKTHLSHVFEKTDTTKQVELVQLFMSCAPPLDLALTPRNHSAE